MALSPADLARVPITRLPALDAGERERLSYPRQRQVRIGIVRPLSTPINPVRDGVILQTADGPVAVVAVASEDAVRVRVHLTGLSLSAGERVRIWGGRRPSPPDRPHEPGPLDVYGPYEGRGPLGSGTLWSPPIEGAVAFIAFQSPLLGEILKSDRTVQDFENAFPFQVDRMVHRYRMEDASATCNASVPAAWQDRLAVGMLEFVSGEDEYACTGTLLDNVTGDGTPFLLTAAHCIRTPEEAQSVRAWWFFDAPPPRGLPLVDSPFSDHALLLHTYDEVAGNDSTLLLLQGALPSEVEYAGWTTAMPESAIQRVRGLHHPQRSYLRYSSGTFLGRSCYLGESARCRRNYLNVDWSDGLTEPGSSGSALWNHEGLVIGQLWGGSSACGRRRGPDDYGRFDVTYHNTRAYLDGTWAGADDGQEPNDTLAAAAWLTPGTFHATDRVVKTGDEDWYQIQVGTGVTLTVDLSYFQAFGDIDVEVYRDETRVAYSFEEYGREHIEIRNDGAPAVYRVRVSLHTGARNTYTLTVLSPLPQFTKLTPGTAANVAAWDVILRWAESGGSWQYDYCYDTIDNNACDTQWRGAAVPYAWLPLLETGQSYFWQVRARRGNETVFADGGQWQSFTIGGEVAQFDAGLQAPVCARFGLLCDSGGELIDGGASRHNTLHDSCADDRWGTNPNDNLSIEDIEISAFDGPLTAGLGGRVLVTVHVPAFVDARLELFHTADVEAPVPVWTYVGSEVHHALLVPTTGRLPAIEVPFTADPRQAIRARLHRRTFDPAGTPCRTDPGGNDDQDDLVFSVAPSQPYKLTPANGAPVAGDATVLTWQPSIGASGYEYCYDTTNDGACHDGWNATSDTSAHLPRLSPGKTYYWQTRALNANGSREADNGWGYFQTAGTPPGAFTKLSPTDGTLAMSDSAVLVWSPAKYADSYEYCYDTTADGACTGIWTATTGTTAAVAGVTAGTTYYWQVRAVNGTGSTPAETRWWSFATAGPAFGDTDGDGLIDSWELEFGLNPNDNSGASGPMGDPDGDGVTNAEEFAHGTHPMGAVSQYLAEGATGAFFDTVIALLNPGATPASVLLRFQKDDATTVVHHILIPALTRRTVVADVLAGVEFSSFSTVIESDVAVIVDRTMTWGGGYGSHAETALSSASRQWYLAEGATGGPFQLFYLLQNPNAAQTSVTVRFLRPAGEPIVRTYTLPPSSRTTVYVNEVDPALAGTDVSATFEAAHPIIVERAMYLNRPGESFSAGHESAGVTAPATRWFLAEGATGPFFDLYVLVANPTNDAAAVDIQFMTSTADVYAKTRTLAPNSRTTIWVDEEEFAGHGKALSNAAVSTTVTSTNDVPIIVERAMWWPQGGWYEAHNSPGATKTATRWALADGEVGGPAGVQTYVLIANTSDAAGTVDVTLHFEDGSQAVRKYTLRGRSRTNINVGDEFPAAVGTRFGAVIESLGDTPAAIVVERAMYANVNGAVWAAGSNALGTALPPKPTPDSEPIP